MWLQILRNIPSGITTATAGRNGRREAASSCLRRFSEPRCIILEGAGQGTNLSMTVFTMNSDTCSVCHEPVKGGFGSLSYLRLGTPVIEVASTPDRNFNVCDLCGTTICWACSQNPDSGYCNECYRQVSASPGRDVNDEEDARAETNLTTTPMQFDQPPKVIPLDDQHETGDFVTSLTGRRELVRRLNQRRQVDVDDLRGRLLAISQKLTDLADEFDEYFRDIDAGIIDVLSANTLDEARDSVKRFFTQ